MLELIIKRLFAGMVTLFAASVVFFAVTEIQTGDFATARSGRFATSETVDMVRDLYGLDRPVHVRYLDWLSHLFEGNFGHSWANGREIRELVACRLGNTLFLAAVTAFFAVPLSVGIGLFAAAKRNTKTDRLISVVTTVTLSTPDYVIAYIVIFLFAITLPWFPAIALFFPSSFLSIGSENIWHRLYTVSLPVLTLSLAMMTPIIRLTRAAVINVLSRPFIEMAILKGLHAHRLLIHHALPHALGPIMNAVILGITNLVVGVIIVEIVFAYPGIGQLMVDAVRLRDVPVVQVCGLIFTVTYISLTLSADLVAILSNPRIATQQPSTTKTRFYKNVKQRRIRRTIAIGTLAGVFVLCIIFGRNYLRSYRLQHIDSEVISNVSNLNTVHRDQLTADELLSGEYRREGPVHNTNFMPIGNTSPALHKLSGTLIIAGTKMSGRRAGASVIRTFGTFPALKVNFFTYQNHLVPIVRNMLLAKEGGSWRIILSPGCIWSESGDRGYSRASFPFTLVGNNWAQVHNGIATFLFDHKRVSALRFQITQESVPGRQFDAWGQAGMSYWPSPPLELKTLTQRYKDELAGRTPIRPWSDLEKTYDAKMLDRIDDTSNRKNITLSGLIIDDVVFARKCRTRYGEYPYCDQMRHGVYSVSKSLGALVAMLRLAQKYGDDVFDYKITDFVPIDANHNGWNKVTFGDALNMATGIGDLEPNRVSSYVDVEMTPLANTIGTARTTNEKLHAIASFGNYPWDPGEVFRYRSSDTFVLAVAMDRFLKSKEGPMASLWILMSKEVFEPLGIYHLPFLHTREPEGESSIPLLGYGMIPTLDEVAKLVKLLRHGGQHQGEQILSATKLAEALGPSMKIGLPPGWPLEHGEVTYHMSFWQHPYRAQSGRFFRYPAMSGHGGNYVLIMPNGITAFRFADGRYNNPGTWDSSGLRKVADYIRPF